MRDPQPVLVLAESGRVEQLESFPHYVARQMGIEDVNECPNLCKMAHDYLRRTKECEDNLFAFFANDPDHESLYVKLVEELDKCILGYFAFHWNHTTPQLNMRIIFRIVLKTLLIPCCGEVGLVEPHEMRKLNGSLVPVPALIEE